MNAVNIKKLALNNDQFNRDVLRKLSSPARFVKDGISYDVPISIWHEDRVRRVTIKNFPCHLDFDLLVDILSKFGKVISTPFWGRRYHPNNYVHAKGNGIAHVYMTIEKDMSDFLKVARNHSLKISYSGQIAVCCNCYSKDHSKKDCNVKKNLNSYEIGVDFFK